MNKKGFTLIELIVSIVLVTIVLASLLSTLVRIRNTYNEVSENTEVLVYSSSISRVINNDVNENAGISHIYCDSSGEFCNMTLGNDQKRLIKITTITDCYHDTKDNSHVIDCSETLSNGILIENIKSTLEYINDSKSPNELVYIKTLELNRYTNLDRNEITREGYNFLSLETKSLNYPNTGQSTTDVFSKLIVNIYDGVDEVNSNSYNVTIYSSNRYENSKIKGKTYHIIFNNNGASTVYSQGIDEDYGIGYYNLYSTHSPSDMIDSIQPPEKDDYVFDGYYLYQNGQEVKMIIDSSGNIVADPKTFTSNINKDDVDLCVKAKWSEIPDVSGITLNGAIEDTIIIKDKTTGNEVKRVNLNGKGIGTLDGIAPGDYIFISTVANDTGTAAVWTDQGGAYYKNVTISSGANQVINLYPAGAIYWYGNGSIEGSSLFSRCGGIYYKTLTADGTSTGTIKKVNTSKSWIKVNKNAYTVRMRSSGGTYYSRGSCYKEFKRNSFNNTTYNRVRLIINKSTASGNVADKNEQGYRISTKENGYKLVSSTSPKYISRDISSVGVSKSTQVYVRVYLNGVSASGDITLRALWLAQVD